MDNNDILIRLRYALDIKDTDMVEIFKLGDIDVEKEEVREILTKTEDGDLVDYVATIKKNRSDLTTENMQFVFLTRNKTTNDIVSDLKDISNVIFPQKNSGDK